MEKINKTFYIAVQFSKETPGSLKDDVNFKVLNEQIKTGILEATNISRGIINAKPVSDVVENGGDS